MRDHTLSRYSSAWRLSAPGPVNLTVSGGIGYSNDLSSFNPSATASPLSCAAELNYSATVNGIFF